jgi:8-oxo-dGTP diphosphatase
VSKDDTGSEDVARSGGGAADEDEASFLAAYQEAGYARPAVTVDLVVLTVLDADLKLLLIRRSAPPFKGRWALPGGFVRVGDAFRDQGEDLDAAARRELAEETSLPEGSVFLEQLHTFGRAYRDPRMRVITVAYFALVRPDLAPLVTAGGDAASADWISLTRLPELALAFDHEEIVEVGLERIRKSLHDSDIAFELVPPTFSIAELRAVYEVIQGKPLDPANFRRRVLRMVDDGLIERAPGKRITGARPARVYRFVARTGRMPR